MFANRVLGLLAAILVTTGQALVLAEDTAAPAQNLHTHARHRAELVAGRVAVSGGTSTSSCRA
jgi:hypothetical protein